MVQVEYGKNRRTFVGHKISNDRHCKIYKPNELLPQLETIAQMQTLHYGNLLQKILETSVEKSLKNWKSFVFLDLTLFFIGSVTNVIK